MFRVPWRVPMLAEQVFRGREAVDEGLLSLHDLRDPAWRHLLRGVYADARLPHDHGLYCHAAGLVIPAEAAVAGPSAAWLLGVPLLGPDDPVHVVVPPQARFGPVRGLRIHIRPVDPADVRPGSQPRTTTALRAAWDIGTWLPLPTAVAFLDAMLRARLVDRDELDYVVAERHGWRGWRAARLAVQLADARAESPAESRLRVRLVQAGLPAPVPQVEVRTAGGYLARVDLAWPERRVAVEYDGAWHANSDQLNRDRRRLNQLVNAGWHVLHVTKERMNSDFPTLVAEIRTALRRPPPR